MLPHCEPLVISALRARIRLALVRSACATSPEHRGESDGGGGDEQPADRCSPASDHGSLLGQAGRSREGSPSARRLARGGLPQHPSNACCPVRKSTTPSRQREFVLRQCHSTGARDSPIVRCCRGRRLLLTLLPRRYRDDGHAQGTVRTARLRRRRSLLRSHDGACCIRRSPAAARLDRSQPSRRLPDCSLQRSRVAFLSRMRTNAIRLHPRVQRGLSAARRQRRRRGACRAQLGGGASDEQAAARRSTSSRPSCPPSSTSWRLTKSASRQARPRASVEPSGRSQRPGSSLAAHRHRRPAPVSRRCRSMSSPPTKLLLVSSLQIEADRGSTATSSCVRATRSASPSRPSSAQQQRPRDGTREGRPHRGRLAVLGSMENKATDYLVAAWRALGLDVNRIEPR